MAFQQTITSAGLLGDGYRIYHSVMGGKGSTLTKICVVQTPLFMWPAIVSNETKMTYFAALGQSPHPPKLKVGLDPPDPPRIFKGGVSDSPHNLGAEWSKWSKNGKKGVKKISGLRPDLKVGVWLKAGLPPTPTLGLCWGLSLFPPFECPA